MKNPGFQEYMYPILDYLKNGETRSKREICDEMAERFQLSDEVKEEMLASQGERTYTNRIGWALSYLKKANLICNSSRAHYQITEEGSKVVNDSAINYIDLSFLRQCESFVAFQNTSGRSDADTIPDKTAEETPFERILFSEKTIRKRISIEPPFLSG